MIPRCNLRCHICLVLFKLGVNLAGNQQNHLSPLNLDNVVTEVLLPASRGGVLEPEGTVEIKYRKRDLLKTMRRVDPEYRRMADRANSSDSTEEEKKEAAAQMQVQGVVGKCGGWIIDTIYYWLKSVFVL